MPENQGLPVLPQPRKKISGCMLTVGLFIALLLMMLAFFISWRTTMARRVDSEKKKIREAGYPTNTQEWNSFYKTPEADATSLWLEAVGLEGQGPLSGSAYTAACNNLPIVGGNGPKTVPPPGTPWPEMDAVKKLLAQYDSSMKKMHEAANKGGASRFPLDANGGFAMLLPHCQTLRAGARMLLLEAHVRAHEGDAHGVAETLHTMFMLAKSLENEPIMISGLVRLAIVGMTIKLLEELLPYVEFSTDDLQRLQADLRTAQNPQVLTRLLAGERAIGIEAFGSSPGMKNALGPDGPPIALATNEDLLAYIKHFDALVTAADEDFPRALNLVQQEEIRFREQVLGNTLSRLRHPFTGLIAPATSAMFTAFARTMASCRTADAALGCELFRRQHKHWPKTLDELVPDFLPTMPLDPFDGKPLRYKPDGEGFVIYSIGKDRVDNGGVEQPDANNEIIFRRPLENRDK